MSSNQLPNHSLNQFLNVLFPDLNGGYIELRFIAKGGGIQSKYYPSIDDVIKDMDYITQQSKRRGVYVGVCPRQEQRGDKSSVKFVKVFWADVDDKNFKGGKTEALEIIKSFPFPPTLIMDTGNGFHVYWGLKEGIKIDSPDDIIRVEAFLKAISKALNADSASAELARVLRIPGTFNHKDPKNPKPVDILESDATRQYGLPDFEPFLASPIDNANLSKNPEGWIATALLELKDGNRHQTFVKITGRLHRDGWTATDILTLLIPQAQKCDFPLDELEQIIDYICTKYTNDNVFPFPSLDIHETEMENKPFQIVSLVDLINGNEEKIGWVVQDIFPSEGVAIISGQPGNCKSWMMQDLAIACASGGKWLDKFDTLKGTVLYVDEESSRPLLHRRLNKLLDGTSLLKEDLSVFFLIAQGLCLNNPYSISHLRTQMKIIKPNLVIIDSLIRVNQAEENSAKEMARVFATVKGLVREFKCCVLFSDHQRKSAGANAMDSLRGSTEKAAFVDTLLSVKRNEDNSLTVMHSKSRFAIPVQSFLVEVEDMGTDRTRVSYTGEAEGQKHQDEVQIIGDFLKAELNHEEWKSRQELVDKAKEMSISQKKLDKGLRYYIASKMIERQDQKITTGRGGKSFVYRWRINVPPTTPLI
jgi:hypothetical protein